ncbi:hypothetical protein [Pseudomonas sp.]|uniref:hypothetical protein n=1 Tax=Pseudomonas sp. TaxID=306 RepID=UPI0028AF00F6|nr:hypothetical protein [Pseudomonas sp.]
MSDTIEITGILNPPAITDLKDDWPQMTVTVSDAAGQVLGFCSTQVRGSSWPFRLYLNQQGVNPNALVTLEARYISGTGARTELARTTCIMPLSHLALGKLELELGAPTGISPDSPATPTRENLCTLNGHVVLPAELCQSPVFLYATVILAEQDGSNNYHYAGNLAEHSLLIKDAKKRAPFSLCIDPNVVPGRKELKLDIRLYDLEQRTIFAGYVINDLDLTTPPDLSALILHALRH